MHSAMSTRYSETFRERIHYDIVKEDDKTSRYSVSLNVLIIKGGKLHF